MAQKGVQLEGEMLQCSICLDLLKDPVTIPCGHSYCFHCVKGFWDGEDQKGIHSCPQCRQTFTARPVLGKSTMLAALVEQLKKTGLQAAPADHCYAGAEDVACDVCSGRKLKATKSCLSCLASYCEEHLQPHYDSAPLRKHKLVEPSKKLQENICSDHDEVMKMFCRTDQKCICYLCSVEEHKGHDTVSAAAERTERQRELEGSRQQIQQRIQDAEKDVKLLQQELEAIHRSADKTEEHSQEIFSQLIRLLQKRSSDVKQQIRSQQEAEGRRVKELQEKLEQEITELKRKDAELQQLSHTEDHSQFLHSWPSVAALRGATHSSSIQIRPLRHFEDVTAAVSELRDKLQDILREEWANISLRVAEGDVLLEPEPESRAGFLRYSCEITLDPNTANRKLLLSEGNRKVTVMGHPQSYSDHPDRFTVCYQVLSRESLTGRCYWEVEMGGEVYVAVAYKNISRAGGIECRFGSNDKSWALRCGQNSYSFWYNNKGTSISGPRASRVGVYLDHRAGILSFYSVSGTMTLLHRVQTTFTQPLWAGTFERLCDNLPSLRPNPSSRRPPVPHNKRIAIAIYKLASCCEYRVVAGKFGVSITTVHRCVYATCRAITSDLLHLYVKMPSADEAQQIAYRNATKHHIPQIYGAIDGSYIPILPPLDGYRDYINRKRWASVILQAVVDDRGLFRNIFAGIPGSSLDAAVLRQYFSDLYLKCRHWCRSDCPTAYP
ncbi:tripartite motif-containing protein 16-like [Odontesthes bonariensis]|uniref:tripartite motif-containing protein 16-like n=1 Tax=Odontesthes bonariensis TaxID=219752 RepID=UPI003F5875A8